MACWCEEFQMHAETPALIFGEPGEAVTYSQLAASTKRWQEYCERKNIGSGAVVAFPAIYNLESISLFFALADRGAILVPLPNQCIEENERLHQIAGVTHQLVGGEIVANRPQAVEQNAFYSQLVRLQHAGLVLFTSGTAGQPKAAVHDVDALCSRYSKPRPCARMLVFMQMDHIGGVNTLLFIVSNGGTMVSPVSRSPQEVCEAIALHSVQVLPTSPTFLNLMLISGCLEQFDLRSLERITYGSEPMPASVLERITRAIPNVKFLQTYGTTELGILKSQSRENGSLWMKVGGDGYEVKIVDGRLWVRAATAMLGYLNAASPFDAEGFMDTGDQVEIDGEWIRILGRKSETINVGGIKVSPVEVESVLLEMPGVLEAAVRAELHPLTGQMVTAVVRLESTAESLKEFKTRMRIFCQAALPAQAIPARVTFSEVSMVTDRFKRAH